MSFLSRLALAGAVATVALSVASAPADAQVRLNWEAQPLYGTQNLRSGFEPDPVRVQVEAGGSDQVPTNLGRDCTGFVNARQPDVDINFSNAQGQMQPGQRTQYKFYIYVQAPSDTTLVVNAPDNRWYCNDDAGGAMGENPMVVFDPGITGNYNIWVGTFERGRTVRATLFISERAPQAAAGK